MSLKDINRRKLEHLKIAKSASADFADRINPFQNIKLNYCALPEIDFSIIDTSTRFLNKQLSFPLIIGAMTGGINQSTKINQLLAVAANEVGVAFSIGSSRILLEDKSLLPWFDMKKFIPDYPFLINLGLVQLNYGVEIDDLKWLCDALNADMLVFHLNPLQESLQQNGDTNFSGLLDKLRVVIKSLNIPVMVKDVGFGLSADVIGKLTDVGVKHIDVSGLGGTNWAFIEGQRFDSVLAEPFTHIGFTVPQILRSLHVPDDVTIVAGGGIRSGVDIFKSLCLGADLVSVARPFITSSVPDVSSAIKYLHLLQDQLKIAMFVTGVSLIDNCNSNLILFDE